MIVGFLYPRFRHFYRRFRKREFRLLDVGCGIHSPTKAKRVFPHVIYHGIDRKEYNRLDDADFARMDRFYELDLETDSLDSIPDDFYEVVILSHVIEHLRNGPEVIRGMTRKLKKGGYIYIEYPSVRSVGLPSMAGTLQFCDAPTHVRLYDLKEVSNILLENECRVLRGGTRRDLLRILFFPLFLVRGLLTGRPASAFWDLLGFAEYVLARKNG